MRKSGVLSLVLLLMVVAVSCTKEEQGPEQTEQAGRASTADSVALQQGTEDSQEQQDSSPAAGKPCIAFEQTEFDFGELEAGEKVEHIFNFRNVGDATLRVHKVRSG